MYHSSLIIHHHDSSTHAHTHAHTHTRTHTRTHTYSQNTINYCVGPFCWVRVDHIALLLFILRHFQRLLSTSYNAWIFNLTTSICMIFIDLSHRRHRFSHPNFRRRKVCLDFGLKSSWACLCRGVYQQVDQRCTWVVTVSMCGDVWLNML